MDDPFNVTAPTDAGELRLGDRIMIQGHVVRVAGISLCSDEPATCRTYRLETLSGEIAAVSRHMENDEKVKVYL